MPSVLELVRNSPFGGPVTHAKCEGFKINDQRSVAALAVGSGSGTNDVDALSSFVTLKVSILNTTAYLLCRVQGQMSLWGRCCLNPGLY